MSYQVIARKYRPQSFADLTGQEHITLTLSRSLDNRRLHHAYLFSGVRGTGKTTTARILAKGLNCEKGITSLPCLECPSCIEIASGTSIDVLEIDAASNTGVDNVRDVIINNIAMAPARDKFKVFIIDEVHMLSASAFNALLKTLEEPPSHVVFILATTELHKVPDTIVSRCQHFEFKQIPTEQIFRRLVEISETEGIKISEASLRDIARAGAGSLRDAQSSLDQIISFSGDEITEEDVTASLGIVGASTLGNFAEAIAGRETNTILQLVEEVASRGHDLRNFSRELMSYLRHILLVKSGITGTDVLGVADVEIERLVKLSELFSEEDLVRSFHLLSETEKEIKDSHHPRFQLEIGLVKLAHLTRLKSLDELIERLEALSSGLSKGTDSGGGTTMPATGNPSEVSGTKGSKSTSAEKLDANAGSYTLTDEPPDFPDFDLSEPEYLTKTPASTRPQDTPRHNLHIHTEKTSVPAGYEVEAILNELQRLNRGLVLTALEDAQKLAYDDGILSATFGKEDMFAKRVRESSTLFKGIGEKLLGRPIQIRVNISGEVEKPVDETVLKRQKLIDRVSNNPAVKLILEHTRGDIVSVKEIK